MLRFGPLMTRILGALAMMSAAPLGWLSGDSAVESQPYSMAPARAMPRPGLGSAVLPVEIFHIERYEPGIAAVPEGVPKRQLIEGGGATFVAHQLECSLTAHPGPHGYAGEAIAHRVVHAVMPADMGIDVGACGAFTCPGGGKPDTGQIGDRPDQRIAEPR